MLLRICLIIAILAGAGVIALSHFKVRPHVQEIIDTRNKNAEDRDKEKAAKVRALAELKDTRNELSKTKTTLAETEKNLETTKGQLTAETKRANGLKQDLAKSTELYRESQQKLARWDAVGLDPVEVKTLIDHDKKLQADNRALDEEKKFFAKKFAQADKQLKDILGNDPEREPPMTAGLRGKVLVVDPKWNFVVLDIGETNGVVQNGVMMISRNSKLIAKVRIMNLEPGRSIANIMPGWKLGEIMEGDQALY